MRRPIVTLLVCALAACGGGLTSDGTVTDPNGGNTGPNLSGNYTLKSVDGTNVPVTLGDSTILSGLLTLNATGWQQVIVVRYAKGGSQSAAGDSLPLAGSYSATASTVMFTNGGTTVYDGTYTSTSFSLTSNGNTFVFTK
jgi:hypothetical protein